MKENQQNTSVSKNIKQFNRECAEQRTKTLPSIPAKYQKRVHNYLIDTSCVLGEGTFSTVYKGKDLVKSKEVAVKVIQINKIKQTGIQHLFKEEINIIQTLNHPNIVACLEYFRTSNNCYTVYQYCEGGDLASLIQKGHFADKEDLRQANIYIKDVFQGLLYLQSLNIIHRDIKAANVFLDKGNAKIGDFGFSTRCNSQFRDASIGSPAYMAPEGLIHNIYGPKTDVWAFGMLIYEMLHGNSPFYQCSSQSQLRVRIKIPINWDQLKTSLPSALKRLILKCLKVDARQRPSFSQLLNDEYIRKLYSEMSVKRINTKSNYSSKTSDTQKIFESTRIMKITKMGSQKQGEGEQINVKQTVQKNKNGQLFPIKHQYLQTEECDQLTNGQLNMEFHDEIELKDNLKNEIKSEQIKQIKMCRISEQEINILKHLMPVGDLSILTSMIDILIKTVSLSLSLQPKLSKPLHFYSVIDQLLKETNCLIVTKNYQGQVQKIISLISIFNQSTESLHLMFQESVSQIQAVQSLFQLIKQLQILIDKQDINLNLQNQTKFDSKTLVLYGNCMIQSYRFLNSLKNKKQIEPIHQQNLSQKLQSSEQFYIWLYELELERMDQA